MSTLAEKIAIMQAFSRGAKIEVRPENNKNWFTCTQPLWDWSECDYRIAKPEQVKLKLIAWFDTATLQLQWFAEGGDISLDWKRVPSEYKEITLP